MAALRRGERHAVCQLPRAGPRLRRLLHHLDLLEADRRYLRERVGLQHAKPYSERGGQAARDGAELCGQRERRLHGLNLPKRSRPRH